MKIKKPKSAPYYMENIQIAIQRGRLLTPADFETLLTLQDDNQIRQFLQLKGYVFSESFTIPEIDAWYRQQMHENQTILKNTSVAPDVIDAFFLFLDQIKQVQTTGFKDFDENLLQNHLQVLETQKIPLIQQYITYRIDFFFIKLLLCYPQQLTKYLPYAKGKLTASQLSQWQSENPTRYLFHLRRSDYYFLFSEIEDSDDFPDLEIRFETALNDLFQPFQHQVQGIEGILGYIRQKNTELYNLRLVLKGHAYQLSPTIIKERMR